MNIDYVNIKRLRGKLKNLMIHKSNFGHTNIINKKTQTGYNLINNKRKLENYKFRLTN